jgi:hypothetical protein
MQLTIISTPTGYRLIPDPENDPIFYATAIKVIADYMIEKVDCVRADPPDRPLPP